MRPNITERAIRQALVRLRAQGKLVRLPPATTPRLHRVLPQPGKA